MPEELLVRRSKRLIETLHRRLAEAEQGRKDALARYAAARPLAEEEREALAQHVESGGALCCPDGHAWLRERLPEPWADAINEWAYERLGCSPGESDRPEHAAKVRALKLDRLP
jgi:hypothetical protein